MATSSTQAAQGSQGSTSTALSSVDPARRQLVAGLASFRLDMFISRHDGPVNGRLVNASNGRIQNSGGPTARGVGVGEVVASPSDTTSNRDDKASPRIILLGVGHQFAPSL